MSDNLPLIPEKQCMCGDVRPLLGEVFRKVDPLPPLPPLTPLTLASFGQTHNRSIDDEDELTKKKYSQQYTSECEAIWRREGELKQEYARRISCEPLPSLYRLHDPHGTQSDDTPCKDQHGTLQRKHVTPTVTRDAGYGDSVWVKSILNRSSCDVSNVTVRTTRMHSPAAVASLPPNDNTVQCISIDDVGWQRPVLPPPRVTELRPSTTPLSQPQPRYIVCVPDNIEFVNFTIGHLHAQNIKLVNVSRSEMRLSVRPPQLAELSVQVTGGRGLRVTAGSAARLRVLFTPRDARALRDALLVRASTGQELSVPISCYMQSPLLHILVPSVTSSTLSCNPDVVESCGAGPGCSVSVSSDVLELGAKLLGDDHRVQVIIQCGAAHAQFFILTEDDWLSCSINSVTADGAVVNGALSITPAWWHAGGVVHALCRCHARDPGLQHAQFRIACSTAATRPLHMLADVLVYSPDHLTLVAHEKDYDICSDDDPSCEYYARLGVAFPGRPLTSTVQLINHSPVVYSYYWSARPWGVCSCWQQQYQTSESASSEHNSEQLCEGALETQRTSKNIEKEVASLVRVEPDGGAIAARSTCCVNVCAPDAGRRLGVQRAVLMLILKNIPIESLPSDYDPMIISTELVECEPTPGVESRTRQVCDLVCLQLEVWWEVVPVRFVLDPPLLHLVHSKRVQQLDVSLRGAQLHGRDPIRASLSAPGRVLRSPSSQLVTLSPSHSVPMKVQLQLATSLTHCTQDDLITLTACDEEWKSQCTANRLCTARDVMLRPAFTWLGVVRPGARLQPSIQLINNTYQQLEWRGECTRWVTPQPLCRPCEQCDPCRHNVCSCSLLHPAAGHLPHTALDTLHCDVNTLQNDGLVATLVRVDTRAVLVCVRTLAPRIMMRVISCSGDKLQECAGCSLDGATDGSVLRPSKSLVVGRRTCYRLRLINLTPIHTSVMWDSPSEDDDVLKVTFIPNEIDIGRYAQIQIKVVLECRNVCGRRVFIHRALVAGACVPLYLVIDTAISGVEVLCEIPQPQQPPHHDGVITIRRTQREKSLPDADPAQVKFSMTFPNQDMFTHEDALREQQRKSSCRCADANPDPATRAAHRETAPHAGERPDHDLDMVYRGGDKTWSRACQCPETTALVLPVTSRSCCLQYINLPLKTVTSRTLVLRNVSELAPRWRALVRRHPARRGTASRHDTWYEDVRPPGAAVQCSPPGGVLTPYGHVRLQVQVYADCWGLYWDQLLIQIEELEPIVLDVWIEAVGPVLQFPLRPTTNSVYGGHRQALPALWMSSSDAEHYLHVSNASAADVALQAYTLHGHDNVQDTLPFRLYLRLFDIPTQRKNPCSCSPHSEYKSDDIEEHETTASLVEDSESGNGVELYLAPDHGLQTQCCCEVSPQVITVQAGARAQLNLKLTTTSHSQVTILLIRIIPLDISGNGWYRPEPQPELVVLQQTVREGLLNISCKELRVKMCSLDLPHEDVLRVRKYFVIRNVGNGPLEMTASTSSPWMVVTGAQHQERRDAGCACAECTDAVGRARTVALYQHARSSTQMCVEVTLEPTHNTSERLSEHRLSISTTMLVFYDEHNMLLQLPLVVELEHPALVAEPNTVDFGFVTDGNTRKAYFSISHTSKIQSLELLTQWIGADEFRIYPPSLLLKPRDAARIYIQYSARWCGGAAAEGTARVWCPRGGGQSVAVSVSCRACPARDLNCSAPPHDYTDDTHLLPDNFHLY